MKLTVCFLLFLVGGPPMITVASECRSLNSAECMDEGLPNGCWRTDVILANRMQANIVATVDCGLKVTLDLEVPARTKAVHAVLSENQPSACKLISWHEAPQKGKRK